VQIRSIAKYPCEEQDVEMIESDYTLYQMKKADVTREGKKTVVLAEL
jgi:hypothetical protein